MIEIIGTTLAVLGVGILVAVAASVVSLLLPRKSGSQW